MGDTDLLNSWKEISKYLGRGVRTVQRWERDFGLPVRRPAGHMKSSVVALRSEIDLWLAERNVRTSKTTHSSRVSVDVASVRRLAESLAQLRKNLQAMRAEHARFLATREQVLQKAASSAVSGRSVA